MSIEAPQIQTPEQLNPSAPEIVAAFGEAQQAIYKLTADAEFHEACQAQGVDPYDDMNKPEYWFVFAQHASKKINETRGQSGNTLQLSALELLSEAPIYLFEQQALDQKSHIGREERQKGRQIVSHFNSAIRIFATEFPEVRASDMEKALLGTANLALEGKAMRQAASHQLHQTIRGAQHELAFGQILEHSDWQSAPASLEEDLRGIDYIVHDPSGKVLNVDVKASLQEVERNYSDSVFAIKGGGTVVMYSMTRDSEFRDKFFTPESVAADKVVALTQFLDQAAEQLAS